MKRILSLVLALLVLTAFPAAAAEEADVRDAFTAAGDYMASLGDPASGDEWMVLGFARSGRAVSDSYYERAVSYVSETIDENERLHPNKATANCRLIVALTAIGKNPTDVGGHNLLAGLNDMDYILKTGVSGPIWTLIAFDCGGYQLPQGVTRKELIEAILSRRTGGGWAISGTEADPDLTGMAITALAPYRDDNADAAAAIETAVQFLSDLQDDTGNFPTRYGTSSETVSQVVVALSTLGIDANTDSRFVKDSVSAIDALLRYAAEDGGFRHIASGKTDGIATEQAYYALTAYFRMQQRERPLYDMTSGHAPSLPEEKAALSPTRIWLFCLLFAGVLLFSVCFVLRKKLGRRTFANAVTAVSILLIITGGISFALLRGGFGRQITLGGAFHRTEIADNRLVFTDNPDAVCTVSIRCDTVLQHLKLLDQGKAPYLPADGVILPEITVEFTPGESAFDLLQRVTEAADIPIEYSWSPLYDSYYLEGIGHLYEYDCGSESGWMYRVNGSFPNVGGSAYSVQPGDRVDWLYSCVGLGADLNAAGEED